MKGRPFILGLISAVVILSGAVIYQAFLLHHTQSELRKVLAAPVATEAQTRAVAIPAARSALQLEESSNPSPTGAKQLVWKSVESDDYRTYIQNLRAIGCPEDTIRDIVIADVEKIFGARRATLRNGGKAAEFWRNVEHTPDAQSVEAQEEMASLAREQTQAIRSLLGIDPSTEQRKRAEGVTYPDNRLGNLSPEKQDRVSLIREEFNEKWQEAQAAAARGLSSEDGVGAALRKLNEDRIAQLKEILMPEELLEHELQTSWTAIQLRNQLAGFQPTETEFVKLYELQKPFDDEYVHYFNDRPDSAALARKEQVQQELNDRIRTALGEQRYKEYIAALHGGQ